MDCWLYENQAQQRGYGVIAGVDEAGRGPLAGPVVAAAVVLPEDFDVAGIHDSKAMTAKSRDKAFDKIMAGSDAVGVGIVGQEIIDEINILKATHRAMRAALSDIKVPIDYILVDGLPVPDLPAPSQAIVKGDAKSVSISAASIVAKVTRDRIMIEYDKKYPQYGFASHKGYGSRAHMEALKKYGPCPCHRRSFAPVAERIAQCCLPGLE